MILSDTDYQTLFPKRNLKEYEHYIRLGRQIARESRCLIYSRGKLNPYLLQSTQESWLYSAHRGNINSKLLADFDYCLCLDHRLKWWSTDGILNSLGWMKEREWTICAGVVSGQLLGHRRIFNYPRFASGSQGEPFHWDVGDLPLKIDKWSNHICVYDIKREGDEPWFNPSFIGIV